jgi:hypothetical protein
MKRTDISGYILPTSATMVGACIMAVSIVRLMEISGKASTIIDNILAVDGLVFLASAVFSYLSLRAEREAQWLERFADMVFLGGLVLMVVASFMLAWEAGHFPVAS